jgi:hypothetical protein
MRIRPGIGLTATLCAQIVAFRVVLLDWPSLASLVALLLLLFVFTPLMFVFCLDLVREFKAHAPSASSLLGRIVFSAPLLVLSLLSLLIGVGFIVAFGSALLSGRAVPPILLAAPEVLVIVPALFFLFAFGMLRVLFSRKHDQPLRELE